MMVVLRPPLSLVVSVEPAQLVTGRGAGLGVVVEGCRSSRRFDTVGELLEVVGVLRRGKALGKPDQESSMRFSRTAGWLRTYR